MWMYIIIPLVLLVIVLIHYLRMKSADKPSPSSVLERSRLEKMLEKELIPKASPEAVEKEDFRFRDDYRENAVDMADREVLQDEYKELLKGGISKFKSRDFDGAELEFSRAIEADTANAAAYYYRGLIKNQRNEYINAVSDFDLAFAYGFSEPDIHMQRGFANKKLKLYDKASGDFSTFLSLQPEHAEARFNKGLCEAASGRMPEAIAEFTRVIELDPKYELAYFERGKAYLKMENKEDACRDFNEAYRKGCLPAHHYLTTICNEKGESF
jgi:tetratricopeptide (TPR) repeat protein